MSEQVNSAPAVEAASEQKLDEKQELSSEQQTDEAKEASPAEQKKEEKKEEIRRKKLKLKVDGKEIEEEFNPDDDEYLIRQFQLAKMAQKRAQEKSSLEKEVNEFISQLRKNPRAILESEELGINLEDLVNSYVNEKLENSQKSPEQLEKEKIEKELKRLKDEIAKKDQAQKEKELSLREEQEYQRYETLMAKAIEKTDLPKSPYIVKKIADYMLTAVEAGFDITPEDVMPLVREEVHSDLKDMFQVMPEEVIEGILGNDVINKLRKKRVAKASEKLSPATTKSQAPDVANTKQEKKEDAQKVSYKDFFKM